MTIEIVIDPNIRIRGNQTYVGFEDLVARGGNAATAVPVVGDAVTVWEPEADLIGEGAVAEVDKDRQLIYLDVDWSSLRPRPSAVRATVPAQAHYTCDWHHASLAVSTVPDGWLMTGDPWNITQAMVLCSMRNITEFAGEDMPAGEPIPMARESVVYSRAS